MKKFLNFFGVIALISILIGTMSCKEEESTDLEIKVETVYKGFTLREVQVQADGEIASFEIVSPKGLTFKKTTGKVISIPVVNNWKTPWENLTGKLDLSFVVKINGIEKDLGYFPEINNEFQYDEPVVTYYGSSKEIHKIVIAGPIKNFEMLGPISYNYMWDGKIHITIPKEDSLHQEQTTYWLEFSVNDGDIHQSFMTFETEE